MPTDDAPNRLPRTDERPDLPRPGPPSWYEERPFGYRDDPTNRYLERLAVERAFGEVADAVRVLCRTLVRYARRRMFR